MMYTIPSVGIDISDYKLRMVTLQKRYRKLQLRNYQEIDVPAGIIVNGSIQQPEPCIALLKELHKQFHGGIMRGRSVKVGLPEQQTFITTLPIDNFQPEIVEMEAIKSIPFERDEMYYNTEINRTMHTVSIAAGRKKYIEQYISILEQADFRPVGLYNEAVALRQALLPETQKLHQQGWIILDIGLARSTVVFVIDGSIYFTTSYPSVITPEGINQQNITAVLQQIMQYYQSHFSSLSQINGILLCGSGAYAPGITEIVTQFSGVQSQPGNPLHRLRLNNVSKRIHQPLVYTTAIGLALLS